MMRQLGSALLVLAAVSCDGGAGADLVPEDSDTTAPAPDTDAPDTDVPDTDPPDTDTPPDTDDTDEGGDTGTPGSTDTGGAPVFSVDVVWTGSSPASAVDVTVNDPLGRTSWNLGLAETEAGAGGWYGEDCYLGLGAYNLCHDFTGDTLHLDQVSALPDIVEGATTLFWSGMNLTYTLDDGAGSCWVWGHDPSYYAALGCTVLGPESVTWGRRDMCSGMDPHDVAPLGGKIALTFDDGPHVTVTPQVLAILRTYNVPATFFVLGAEVADPATWPIVDDIVADPLFEIANHSWDHADLALLSEADVRVEIEDTNDLLETFTGGVTPPHFRFPYGDSTCFTADLVRDDYGQIPTGWHIDTVDWCYASGGICSQAEYWRIPAGFEADMRGYVLDQALAFDGGVVLMHDIHQYTADNLEDIILDLLGAGFTFVPLSDAAAFPNLVADTPYDFPWMGEGCDTTNDTCWQVEYLSWCEPTGDPAQPATSGICVLPCDTASECTDRDGTAPLFCADTSQGGTCVAESEQINGYCLDVPGSVETSSPGWPSGANEEVCLPFAW